MSEEVEAPAPTVKENQEVNEKLGDGSSSSGHGPTKKSDHNDQESNLNDLKGLSAQLLGRQGVK